MAVQAPARAGAWIPEGPRHDLNVERHPGRSIGAFTGGGWKIVWHITVSPWRAIDSMVGVLIAKGAEPQLVIGGRAGFTFPVLVQMLGLNEAGKALQHPPGTPETNRANAIQVEICATVGNAARAQGESGERSALFDLPDVELPREIIQAAHRGHHEAADLVELCISEDAELARTFHSGVAAWTDDTYKALANLGRMIDYRAPVPVRLARSFHNTTRLSPAGWVTARGHLGHMHCPGNTHIDPTTAFLGRRLIHFMMDGWQQL